MKSSEQSVGAIVCRELLKHSCSSAEDFLLTCVLEREMSQLAISQFYLEHGRDCFPCDCFFSGGQVEKVSLLTVDQVFRYSLHVNEGCWPQ